MASTQMMMRPNRSDVHLTSEEEAKIERETRDYFDSLAPKRHSKPPRSDVHDLYIDDLPNTIVIPELAKFQNLQNQHPLKLDDNGNPIQQQVVAEEEYIETEYYKDLNCIDKQHHTTGTGFIKVMDNNNTGSLFRISSPNPTVGCHFSSKGNPATNDWIPVDAASDMEMVADSHKPNRSDL